MDLGIENRTALVSGSSRGIGRAIAAAFLQEGCRTMVTAREARGLEECRESLATEFGSSQVLSFAGDLTNDAAIRECRIAFTRQWGAPDFVVANIGSGRSQMGPLPDLRAWRESFEGNLWSAVQFLQEFLPEMISRGSGSAVVIGSIAGMESIRAPLPYSAAKAALESWVKNAAREVGSSGVRINLVSPGNISFDGGSWHQRSREDPEGVRRYLAAEVPLVRFGTPEDVASLVVFLCSDRAAFVTGARFVADGGQTRSL